MTGDLIINDKDAFDTWGVNMGDGFIDSIYAPNSLKGFVENKSRLEDGKRVIINNPKIDERDITLTFVISGSSSLDYTQKYRSFKSEIEKGSVDIKVPVLGGEVYRLVFQKSTSFSLNLNRTASKLTCKFNEPNPANR